MPRSTIAQASKPRAPALIPRAVLFADPTHTTVRVSPDGKRLAYLAPLDGIVNLWVAPLDAPKKGRPVTRYADRSISGVTWLHDNRRIVFMRDNDGGESGVYVIGASGGYITCLTCR